jgi:WXG100 family type VII secretion target
MPAAKVRADYEQLAEIARRFGGQADSTQVMLQSLKRQMQVLEGGDWVGRSADKFYAEMNSSLLPTVQRLTDALSRARQVTQQISKIMKDAEDAAAALFKAEASNSAGPATPQAGAGDPFLPKWLTDILAGVFLGDFSENSSLLKLLAQIVVGFTPAAPLADVRDIIASIKDVIQGKDFAWVGLGIAVVAIIPGLDALKAGKALRPIFKALGDEGSREVVEFLVKNPDQVGRVAKTLGTLLDNPSVIDALAKNPDAAMVLIRNGSPELVGAFAKYGDEAVEVAAKYGDDGAYVATNFDRYKPLAADPAHAGAPTAKTLRESGVGLALEGRGQLPGPITRYPTPAAEFTDATGQAWDIKTFNSSYPNGFELPTAMRDIQREIRLGENVIVDTKDMSAAHVTALRDAVQAAGLEAKVLWYP